MIIEINDEALDVILKEVLLNLPAYSLTFPCFKHDYVKHIYHVEDVESERVYVITLPLVRQAFQKMVERAMSAPSPTGVYFGLNLFDPGEWDAPMLDDLILEIVYGIDAKLWE